MNEGMMKFIGGVDFKELKERRIQVYRTIEFNLATAKTDYPLEFTGNYLYVIEATDIKTTISVRLNEQSRGLLPLYKGRGIRAPFHRLYVTHAAQGAKTLNLAIGVESDTFEVFDVGKALEISGAVQAAPYIEGQESAFFKSGGCGPGAGMHSHVQLWNPADSGVTAYLTKIAGSGAVASQINLHKHDTALLTVIGEAFTKDMSSAVLSNCILKAQLVSAKTGTELGYLWTNSAGVYEYIFNTALKIPPGWGVILCVENQNEICHAYFEWSES